MRKYQQLLLLIISAFSVIILILYKNENNRLKDVLHIVNIFGRSDEAVLRRLENFTKDDLVDVGLPIWQSLTESYHVYSSFWNRNELMAGGEVLAIIVGKRGAVVNFGCSLLYDGGSRNIRGKFQFQRIDNNTEDFDSEYTIYNFFCRIVRDFGSPEGVVFNDNSNTRHTVPEIRIRHIKNQKKEQSKKKNVLNICVNLATLNRTSNFSKNDRNLLQFFLHHQGLGVTDFLVYNGDLINQHVLQLLKQFNMRLHLLPFNFPFTIGSRDIDRVRRIIENDCLIRNMNLATYAILLEPNEFFYPNAKIESSKSLLRSMHYQAADFERYELPVFSVCIDRKYKLLLDSTLYDAECKISHKIFINHAYVPVNTAIEKVKTVPQSTTLHNSMGFVHIYVDCIHVGKDGLHDWRSSLRKDNMQLLQELRNELDMII